MHTQTHAHKINLVQLEGRKNCISLMLCLNLYDLVFNTHFKTISALLMDWFQLTNKCKHLFIWGNWHGDWQKLQEIVLTRNWTLGWREEKDGGEGQPVGAIKESSSDNHVFDISVSGEWENMGEKKMNWQGIRSLKRKMASLKMLSFLNTSGRKWEEGLWSEKRQRK